MITLVFYSFFLLVKIGHLQWSSSFCNLYPFKCLWFKSFYTSAEQCHVEWLLNHEACIHVILAQPPELKSLYFLLLFLLFVFSHVIRNEIKTITANTDREIPKNPAVWIFHWLFLDDAAAESNAVSLSSHWSLNQDIS